MPELTLQDFHRLTGAAFLNLERTGLQGPIRAISTDTRALKKGEVFWALIGERFDGHNFVAQAVEKGARFCVVQKNRLTGLDTENLPLVVVPDTLQSLQELAKIYRGKFSGTVIALTGSNGKTTTKEMIAHILSQKLKVHKTQGNLNNHIGCPLTLLQLDAAHQVSVVELGSNHPGEIARLAEITQPDQALVTNIGEAHLEFFRNRETVAKEKLSLFDALPETGIIYQNVDDPFISGYAAGSRRTLTYGLNQTAQVHAQVEGVNDEGCATFILNGRTRIALTVPGLHQVRNALAASAVALQFGFSEQEIKQALETYTAPDKRMQTVRVNGVTFLNDAYNANPVSMQAAFETIAGMKRMGRLFLVLGDMLELGEAGPERHRQTLQQALDLNPEKVLVLGKEMSRAAQQVHHPQIEAYADHAALFRVLRPLLNPGDLVLLKGSRGIQLEKILSFFIEEEQTKKNMNTLKAN